MKKTIVFVLCLCGCIWSGLAQRSNYKPEYTIGVKGGITLSNVSFSPSIKQNWLLGYTGGVSFRYIEEKFFGLIVEANYTRRGWDQNFEDLPYSYTRTLDYIEIPFMTHFFFGNRWIRGFINAGPQIGFLIASKHNANFDRYDLPDFANTKINPVYTMDIKNKIDYGITAGAGVEFRIKRKHGIVLEARYYYGLGDLFGNSKSDVFSASHNQSILVSLGYLFHL